MPVQAGNVRHSPGSLLSTGACNYDSIGRTGRPPSGLYLALQSGTAARLQLRLRSGDRGIELVRPFVLTPRGAWISASGWEQVDVEVLSLGSGASVGYAWTALQPPDDIPLLLPQAIAAGTHPVPSGAARVLGNGADNSWQWRVDDGSDDSPYVVGAPLVVGTPSEVFGAEFVATVDNVLLWELEAP